MGGPVSFTCDNKTWLDAPSKGTDTNSNLSEAPDGSMVIVGGNILAVGRPGSFRVARAGNGLPSLTTAIQGRDGTLWLAGAQGLFRFASPFRMEYWTPRDGVDAPYAVERNGDDVYAGLDHQVGMLTKDRRRWQMIASFQQIGQVTRLQTTGEGNMLAALNPGGAALIRRDGTLLARIHDPFAYGLRFAVLPNNEVWLGGLRVSLLKRNGTVLQHGQPRTRNDTGRKFCRPAV